MNDDGRPSIHHLPLPPIPTDVAGNSVEYEYTSELKLEANQAYSTNTNDAKNRADDSNLTTEANRAYGSNLVTEPNKVYELNSTTEAYQAYELDDIMTMNANNSGLKTEENKAYGSKLSGEPNNEAAGSQTRSTAAYVPTDENIAYGHSQLVEENDMYEYI